MTGLGRHALGISLAAVLPVACGASHPIPPALLGQDNIARHKPVGATPEKVLYRFRGGPDGRDPIGPVTNVNGIFYGTTYGGGASDEGTVFSFSTSGKHRVVYSFKKPPDGTNPTGLVNVKGTLYGTNSLGGYDEAGAVFAINTSGKERIVYSFKGGTTDGSYPNGLIVVNGILYGTTLSGGDNSKGTVFAVRTSGVERTLYNFKGSSDGAYPYANLIDVKGTLYGSTSDLTGSAGWGTVFSVSTAGKEHTLYRFKGPPDGVEPLASLINSNGIFYGTTSAGGTNGWGTVFSVTMAGKERVIYSFEGGNDGMAPEAPLVIVRSALHGTTNAGGGEQPNCDGCGTVFSVSTAGSERVLHSFQDNLDGAYPQAGLTILNGALYGTTAEGGYGNGTVYRVMP
jgi:uncharacterized repeat protein (TIGR03803 family)